jgi:hypothetical protein
MVSPHCLECVGRNRLGFGALDNKLELSLLPAMELLPQPLFLVISSEEEAARSIHDVRLRLEIRKTFRWF